MTINWSGIGEVFAIGLGATVVVVVMFSLGITALARRQTITTDGRDGSASTPLAAAVLCFLVCAAVVGYGLYLIVAK